MHKVVIEYCVVWNYYPKAAGLAEEIKKKFDNIDIEYLESSGGKFEVSLDGNLIFSKTDTFRFPEPGEVERKIAQEIN